MDDAFPSFSGGSYKALVIGARGAIGAAFVEAFQVDPWCTHVECLARSLGNGFDITDETSINAQAHICSLNGPYDIIIDATGALTINGIGPEKSLLSLHAEHLQNVFLINAIGPAMVLRYFSPLLAKGASVYAKLSARVGSIGDNKKGGWYGYRSSKAALNMFLQTAALELQRKNPALRVVALQPGTVRSELSQGFTSASTHLLEPHESVGGMLQAMKTLPAQAGAHFVDYKGTEIPW